MTAPIGPLLSACERLDGAPCTSTPTSSRSPSVTVQLADVRAETATELLTPARPLVARRVPVARRFAIGHLNLDEKSAP